MKQADFTLIVQKNSARLIKLIIENRENQELVLLFEHLYYSNGWKLFMIMQEGKKDGNLSNIAVYFLYTDEKKRERVFVKRFKCIVVDDDADDIVMNKSDYFFVFKLAKKMIEKK